LFFFFLYFPKEAQPSYQCIDTAVPLFVYLQHTPAPPVLSLAALSAIVKRNKAVSKI
jgi:hypothetical protein